MELSSVNTRLQFSPQLYSNPPKPGEQRPMPETFYGDLHTLHSNETTPLDLDFRTVRGKPEKVTLTTPVKRPDGSEITEVYSFANALKQHYESGTIEKYQHDLQAKGQQTVEAVIRVDDEVVGTLMPDDKFRWFSADVRTNAVTESDTVAASYAALKEQYGERLTISSGLDANQPVSYAQIYAATTGIDYSQFIHKQVTNYRIAAEKFLAS
ncbi:hypothetical protein SAMN06297229_1990 [Pseudidiomarina planktonica]|uniref:Uncharacterized protein n=1 Tax=Pseudidiomarina planktonica TaxID=1323738 RepID=A0A1Y6FYL5_9GAMM|nr:hypothetical protein [Pseudidiomarina planktonica]RUO63853.1 hypothetical protein CWI77_09015 [Pseudidiomarina planktonica]SMQ80076.1 hypothetical protein SAMN06297229_1990 [Pseudidiomarina planktonica]